MRNIKLIKIKHYIQNIDKFLPKQKNKTNWKGIVSFVSGSLLTISETMPFFDNESNGMLHALSKIVSDYKNTNF